MANSINTNVGALVALQNLNATSRELNVVQNRVNTGLKVASAKDNGAIWAMAENQKANMQVLNATRNSLQRTQSVNDVGLAAGETIMDALRQMKELAAGDMTNASVLADLAALREEVVAAKAAASFDSTDALSSLTLTIGAAPSAAEIDADLASAITALQAIGTSSKSTERSLAFNDKLQNALEAGISNLVDADLAKESARLTALQTKQQLGVQALSIANQSSSILLGLFR
ncbi:MAG: flagellin [Brevundimonas sp.]|uniref:flagellin n=1 Tax=Brevundimonas sp. TaxID=1871086 RepID=UPI002734F597|nr:flagellin [Brevundimonas sp.]MDP3369828.1 flagellin [Brevundimonas sp.]MDP3656368.1 flagellin [Brevundimonas sp.]MDZ4113362.1 flagellin [Brevundimonas sp.]